MSIVRAARPNRAFLLISNAVCQDERLSMRALGVLVRLLSRPDGWRTNSEALAAEFGVGREQMRAVLRELASNGYMRLDTVRARDGTLSSCWQVFDEPQEVVEKAVQPAPENRGSGGLGPIEKTDEERTNTPVVPLRGRPTDASDETPHQAIVDAYHQELPNLPQARLLTEKRQRLMRKLWRWVMTSTKEGGERRATTKEEGVAWMHNYFAAARDNDFLMGRTPRSAEHKNWKPDIDFLLSERGMKQILERT